MPKVAVNTGKEATINMLEHSAVQQKTGMRMYPIPGARSFRMVVTMLIPASSVPMPEICSAHR